MTHEFVEPETTSRPFLDLKVKPDMTKFTLCRETRSKNKIIRLPKLRKNRVRR